MYSIFVWSENILTIWYSILYKYLMDYAFNILKKMLSRTMPFFPLLSHPLSLSCFIFFYSNPLNVVRNFWYFFSLFIIYIESAMQLLEPNFYKLSVCMQFLNWSYLITHYIQIFSFTRYRSPQENVKISSMRNSIILEDIFLFFFL